MPNSTHNVNTEQNWAEKIPNLSAESNQQAMQIAWKKWNDSLPMVFGGEHPPNKHSVTQPYNITEENLKL